MKYRLVQEIILDRWRFRTQPPGPMAGIKPALKAYNLPRHLGDAAGLCG